MGIISRVRSVGYQANPSVPEPGCPQFCGDVSMSEDEKNVALAKSRLTARRIALQRVSARKTWKGE
jgi:hypothetical protein